MEKKDKNWAWGQIVDMSGINERGKIDNTQEHIILLAQINQLKEMQIFCLQKEQKLREELTRLGYNEYDEQLKEKRNK